MGWGASRWQAVTGNGNGKTPSGSSKNNHRKGKYPTWCRLLKKWAELAYWGEAGNGHRRVSLKKVRGGGVEGTICPWYLKRMWEKFSFLSFNLSKSQVFIYKIEDKVGPWIEAFGSSVASWKARRLWRLKDPSLHPLNCYVTLGK